MSCSHEHKGPSFFTLLGLLFITLKLVGVISWSWLAVLAPFWVPWMVLLTFAGIVLLAALLGALS